MKKGHIVDIDNFRKESPLWPTHKHEPSFWEALGRAIACIGLLEESLAKAIFVITGSKPVSNIENADIEVKAWAKFLQRTVSDPLGQLINKYEIAVRDNKSFNIENFDELLRQLRMLRDWRDILCHSSWGPPDAEGKSVPFFVNRNGDIVQNKVHGEFLIQIMNNAAELTLSIVNTITSHGFQWPGSNGPGKPAY